jgi:hypothetical protein
MSLPTKFNNIVAAPFSFISNILNPKFSGILSNKEVKEVNTICYAPDKDGMTYEVRVMWNDTGKYAFSTYCSSFEESSELKQAYNENHELYCNVFETILFKEASVTQLFKEN